MKRRMPILPRTVLVGALLLSAGPCATRATAQTPATTDHTVADGVYADAQATRGEAFYEVQCTRCHRIDLEGAEGPPLRGDRFAKDFAGKPLKDFYVKIATTMPGTAPASLSSNVYLDIVAHVLRENGFPAGPNELTPASMADVRILPGRPKPLPPVEDYSYVEAVGCLTPGPSGVWLLTHGSDPVSARPGQPADPAAPGTALGAHTIHLLDARAYSPQSRQGQKVYVRGILVRMPHEEQMTLSALDTLAPACGG